MASDWQRLADRREAWAPCRDAQVYPITPDVEGFQTFLATITLYILDGTLHRLAHLGRVSPGAMEWPLEDDTDDVWRRDEVESPCLKFCVVHPGGRLFLGCLRSLDEIAHRSRMTADPGRG